jgi:hypothetical protein
METLAYQAEVFFSSPSGKRGSSVTFEVRLDPVVDEVRRFYMTVPGYSVFVTLSSHAERPGVFTGMTTVPWEAPSGTYPLNFYGVDADGNRGPVLHRTFTVT